MLAFGVVSTPKNKKGKKTMSYAILRAKKLKEWGNICASLEHNFRERLTPNADSHKTAQNVHIGAKNTEEVRKAIQTALPPKFRSDCVKCVEYLITASPEWFAEHDEREHQRYFERSIEWLKERHGAENIKCISIHNDESTPHLVAYIVPLDERGKLNAKKWLGGKKLLAEMQSNFADRVAEFGLNRGIEGSKAKHERVRRFYGEINDENLKFTADDVDLKLLKKGLFQDTYESNQSLADRLNLKLQGILDLKNKKIRELEVRNSRIFSDIKNKNKSGIEELRGLNAVYYSQKCEAEEKLEALKNEFDDYRREHRINTKGLSMAQIDALNRLIENEKEKNSLALRQGGMKI